MFKVVFFKIISLERLLDVKLSQTATSANLFRLTKNTITFSRLIELLSAISPPHSGSAELQLTIW